MRAHDFEAAVHVELGKDGANMVLNGLVLEEKPGGSIPLTDPQVTKARAKLFGAWEMNWLAYNYAHDVKLPGASDAKPIPFLMYPQAETANERKDSLDPPSFKYTITSKELTG